MTSIEKTNECKYFNIATLSNDLRTKRFELNDLNYFSENIADVTNQKHVMSVDMFKWKQDVCRHVSIMTSTICLNWHAQNDMSELTCSKRYVCWHNRMSKARYLLICSNDKSTIFADIFKWQKQRMFESTNSLNRKQNCEHDMLVRIFESNISKTMRLQKQCIKTNFTKISFIFFVLQYNLTNYTMIAIKLSRNVN